MQSFNLSDSAAYKSYADSTKAVLRIKSVAVANSEVNFAAFLTDFSQTFDANWNTEEVFGRMDPIATYQGTKRTMTLGFDVPSGELLEAQQNLQRCANLVKMTYPVYEKGILSKPPLVRIKFANLIRGRLLIDKQGGNFGGGGGTVQGALDREGTGEFDVGDTGVAEVEFDDLTVEADKKEDKYAMLLGWISGLSWTPNLEMGMFSSQGELYPKVISLNFSFNILHEQQLSQGSAFIGSFPF